MFGLLYYAITGICKIANDIVHINENIKEQNRAIRENKDIYIDYRGFPRQLGTNKTVYHQTINGDRCLTYGNGEVVRNYSKEFRDAREKENLEKAIKNGDSVYLYKFPDQNKKDLGYKFFHEMIYKNYIYKDIKNGNEYVIASVSGFDGDYYMDVYTGYLVRESDNSIKNLIGDNKLNNDKIMKINEQIKNNNIYIRSYAIHIKES